MLGVIQESIKNSFIGAEVPNNAADTASQIATIKCSETRLLIA